MSLIFFLKPHYKVRAAVIQVREGPKKRKKRTFEIKVEGRKAQAKEIDLTEFAKTLFSEQKKRQRRKKNEAIALVLLFEDD